MAKPIGIREPDLGSGRTRPRAAERAADRVRQAILAGEVAPGAHLPAERELADRLGVSRLTLRAALSRLEAEGLVRSVHGSGTRVLDFRESGGIDLVGYLARQAIDGGTLPVEILADLLELRRMLAVEVLGLLCERASADDLNDLRDLVGLMRERVADGPAFMQADLSFARRVVQACGNLALELLANTVLRLIEQHPGLALAFVANAPQTVVVYDKLLGLVQARDPDKVRRVTRRLVERLDRVTLERVGALSGSGSGGSGSGGSGSGGSGSGDSGWVSRPTAVEGSP